MFPSNVIYWLNFLEIEAKKLISTSLLWYYFQARVLGNGILRPQAKEKYVFEKRTCELDL